MKKKIFILSLIMFSAIGMAFADGMVFDPTEYPTIGEIPMTKTPASSPAAVSSNDSINANIKESSNYAQNSISGQSENFNNALYELDSAQVNIRNDLLDYQAKYQEVDTQYQLIKEQRKVLADQIKSVERRIKDIERSKNNIRKSMI